MASRLPLSLNINSSENLFTFTNSPNYLQWMNLSSFTKLKGYFTAAPLNVSQIKECVAYGLKFSQSKSSFLVSFGSTHWYLAAAQFRKQIYPVSDISSDGQASVYHRRTEACWKLPNLPLIAKISLLRPLKGMNCGNSKIISYCLNTSSLLSKIY